MKIHIHRNHLGFTLVEIMIATSIAMVLLFGALYSTSETLNVVREADAIVHTNVHARRVLDRMLKDVRYSSALAFTGNAAEGWNIAVTTTGTLDPGALIYSWSPNTGLLSVTGPNGTEPVLESVRNFDISTLTAEIDGATVITRVSFELELGISSGFEAGADSIHAERSLSLGGATWVRRNDS